MSEDEALPRDESDANDDHASDRGLTLEYRGSKVGGPIERRSCTPGTGEFVNRQPFVPAVIRKGRPKCGESVPGYTFEPTLREWAITGTRLKTEPEEA